MDKANPDVDGDWIVYQQLDDGREDWNIYAYNVACLLYTSDAADDLLCVDLGGRRIIQQQISLHHSHVAHDRAVS